MPRRPKAQAKGAVRPARSRGRRRPVHPRTGRDSLRPRADRMPASSRPAVRRPRPRTASAPPARPTATRPPSLAASAVTGASKRPQSSGALPHRRMRSTLGAGRNKEMPVAVHADAPAASRPKSHRRRQGGRWGRARLPAASPALPVRASEEHRSGFLPVAFRTGPSRIGPVKGETADFVVGHAARDRARLCARASR